MGMMIDGREEGNRAPLSVRGGAIRAIDWTSPVASAQVKSAILLAGLQAAGRSSVTEPARSRDHSERMLQAMGARIETAGTTVAINGRRPLEAVAVHVPGDLSAAAFWIVAAALLPGSDLVLAHVGLNPTRTGILDALGRMGADITVLDRREVAGEPVGDLRVRHARLHGIDLAGEEVVRAIDEIPILALAMACAEGESCIRDAGELRLKEADRLTGIQEVLGGLGARIRVAGDRLEVAGMTRWRGGEVDCLKDHRLAMMAAIAAQLASDEVRIVGAEATDTSYPTFWEHLGRFSG
jgi:3-phosphoshikimate 1-carboxyvinyltransferase